MQSNQDEYVNQVDKRKENFYFRIFVLVGAFVAASLIAVSANYGLSTVTVPSTLKLMTLSDVDLETTVYGDLTNSEVIALFEDFKGIFGKEVRNVDVCLIPTF